MNLVYVLGYRFWLLQQGSSCKSGLEKTGVYLSCVRLSVSGHGLIWWLLSVGIFDLAILPSTAFSFQLPPSCLYSGHQKREKG